MAKSQYPSDYNPPNRGKCQKCGVETKAWGISWLALCPMHWQELVNQKKG